MGNCMKHPEDVHWAQWSDEFHSLQLKKSEIRKLYKIFLQVDKDHSGNIDLNELLDHLEMSENNTIFRKRVFSIFDEDGSGQIDFREFVLALWNYCTLSRATLVVFAFDLYDKDNTGELNPMEIDRMLKDLYGSAYHSNPQAVAVSGILNRLTPEEELDVQKFEQFVHTHPILLFPAFQIQSALQSRILGTSFWERAAQRRIELSEGQFIPVAKFLELNLNSNLFDSKVAYDPNIKTNAKYALANSGTYFYRHANAVNPHYASRKQWFQSSDGGTDMGSCKFNGQHKKDVHDVLRTKKQAITIEKVLADVRKEESRGGKAHSKHPAVHFAPDQNIYSQSSQATITTLINNDSESILKVGSESLYSSPFDSHHSHHHHKTGNAVIPTNSSSYSLKEIDQTVQFKATSKPNSATRGGNTATNNNNNSNNNGAANATVTNTPIHGSITPLFGSTESLRSYHHPHAAAGFLETGGNLSHKDTFSSKNNNSAGNSSKGLTHKSSFSPVKGTRRITLDSIPSQRAINYQPTTTTSNSNNNNNQPMINLQSSQPPFINLHAHASILSTAHSSRNNSRSNSRAPTPNSSRKETPVKLTSNTPENSLHKTHDSSHTTTATNTTTTTTAAAAAVDSAATNNPTVSRKSSRSRNHRRTF